MTSKKDLPKGVYKLDEGDDSVSHPRYVNSVNLSRYTDGKNYHFCTRPEDVMVSNTAEQVENIDKGKKYLVTIRNRHTGESIQVDVYDVLEAFKITCSAMAHAIKKLLMAGKRGAKGFDKDCNEAINSVEQSKLLEKYRGMANE